MKKFLASLFVLISCILCISLAACTGSDNKVKITFEVNGGVEIAAVSVEKGEQFTLPEPDAREGYEFDGWYLNEGLTGASVTEITAEKDVTVYAKWAKLYTVTLNADGGTLSVSTFKLKEGASLYEAVKSYVPTKTDYKFDAWLNGTNPVTLNTKMPSADVILKARYLVKYTVEIYKQKLDGNGYEDTAEYIVDYGTVGGTVYLDLSSDVTTGFTYASNSDLTITLSADASENVCKVYLDRQTFTVTFHANYPGGNDTIVKTSTVRYGTEVVLPNDIAFGGYCLTGWALSASGALAYKVDAITGKLYNPPAGTDTDVADAKFTPSRDIGLYAVWVKGYTDMFGGEDAIYVFDTDGKVAYLCRNDIYFVGTYNASNNKVTFTNDEYDLACRLLGDGTFVYYDDVRAVSAYSRYVLSLTDSGAAATADDKTQLHFDGYNGIMYTTTDAAGKTHTSEGTFVLDEYGYYVSTFTEGDIAGETLTFWLTEVTSSAGESIPVFRVRNDEEYELGVIYCSALYNGELTYYEEPYYSVYLSGFNVALYVTENSYAEFIYFIEDGILTLVSTSTNTIYLRAKLTTIDDATCYVEYSEEHVLTATSGSDKLVLDGYGNAVYTADGKTLTGYYVVSDTGFGDYLVTMYADGKEYANFIVKDIAERSEDDEEEIPPVYTYTAKPVGYTELNYTDDKYLYTATFLVLNDDGEGLASIYCDDSKGNVYKISTGTFEEVNGLFVYTKKTWDVPSGLTLPFKSKNFTSFVFTVGMKEIGFSTYYVNLWTEYKEGDVTEYLYKEYTDGENKLDLLTFAKVAIYKIADEDYYIIGDYSESSTEGVIILYNLYIELNDEDMTFEVLSFAPYTIYALTPAHEVNENVYLSFSGKVTMENQRLCTYYEVDGEGNVTSVAGLFATDTADFTCTFTSDDGTKTITFKILASSTEEYMALYDETYKGVYTSPTYGRLELDGYGANATYDRYSGTYAVMEDDLIVIISSGAYVYIDLDLAGKTFTVRDSVYGSYLFFDNQYLNGYVFSFDGYGNLSVYKMVDDGEGGSVNEYIDENGSYEINGDSVTVHYTNGGVNVDRQGVFGIYTFGNNTYRTFGFTYTEIANTYVNTSDWSILSLDGNGNAVKYDEFGQVTAGTYVIITENLLYFVNADETDASLFVYDTVAATATPVNKLQARGYYTEDMQSLLFSRYGFAIFNGSERYYYNVEDNKIIIYRHAEEGESGANKYGYVKVDLGNFSKEIQYGGKTYYYNDGYDITFNRTSADKSKYKVNVGTEEEPDYVTFDKVIFTPSGDNESYTVSGIAVLGGKNLSCTVSRAVEDDGETGYYVMVDNHRFKVSLTYGRLNDNGESLSSFTVTELADVQVVYSDTYLTYYYIYATMFGMRVSNTWGLIEFVSELDEESNIVEEYVDAVFGVSSYAYDLNGELVSFDKAAYEYDEETGAYTVVFEHTDGYVYTLSFITGINRYMNMLAYRLLYITRGETLVYENYTVEVQVLITSEAYNSDYFGTIYAAKLYEDGVEIESSLGLNAEGGIYYVSRTTDESGKITATTYYMITLNGEDADGNVIPPFTEAKVKKLESVVTYYGEDGKSYADVDTAENEILYVYIYDGETEEGAGFGVSSCEYSAAEDSYIVVLSSGKVYTVEIKNGKIVLTESSAEGN